MNSLAVGVGFGTNVNILSAGKKPQLAGSHVNIARIAKLPKLKSEL